MKNYFFIIIIIILINLTSFIKTTTREIEAKIFNSEEQIKILIEKKELILLENNFLSSPERLFEFKKKLFDKKLIPLKLEKFVFVEKNEK
tara:strand:+ start:278 stop:547 length:270 start_codon:yes stop_codon:yes gene_type:complete